MDYVLGNDSYLKNTILSILMAAASWFRYIIGILLSLDVVRVWLTGGQLQTTTIGLAVIFLMLALLYVVKRI